MSKQSPSTVELKEIFPNNNVPIKAPSTVGSLINSLKKDVSTPSTINNNTNNNQSLVNTNHPPRPTAMQKNVAPFLNKVYGMVNDPSTDDLIRWSDDGKSFFVVRHEDFARTVLPRFFKHSNFSSFVRQLNMYGFHKVPHLQHGVLHSDSDSEQWEFSNPHFQRNQPDLLLLVTRKKGRDNEEKEQSTTSNNIDLHHILEEIQVIKQHQLNISSQLKNIQNDNSVLWQETILARDRYQRHQETIDKILRFLASVFSNDKSMAIPRKRRYLLEAPDSDKSSNQNNQYDNINNNGNTNGNNDNSTTSNNNSGNRNKKTREAPPPSKIQKISGKTPEFKLEDYVDPIGDYNGNSDFSSSFSSSLPQSAISSNPSSELADAIALNDKSKQGSSIASLRSSLPPDLSQVISNQQLQGLQRLISLAQSNPTLLNQLTDAFNSYHQINNNMNNNMNSSIPSSISANPTTTNLTPMTDYSQIAQLFDANTLNLLSNSMATIPSSMSSTSNPYTVTSPSIPPSPSTISSVSFNDFSNSINSSTAPINTNISAAQPNMDSTILPYSEISEIPLSHSNSIPSTTSTASTPSIITANNNNDDDSSNPMLPGLQLTSAPDHGNNNHNHNHNNSNSNNGINGNNSDLTTSTNSNSLSTNHTPSLEQVTSDIESVIKENDSVNTNIDNVVNDIFGFLNTDFLE